jgi:hypothetical protein
MNNSASRIAKHFAKAVAMGRAIKGVFARPAYFVLAATIFAAAFAVSVLLPNYPLVFSVFADANVSLEARADLIFKLLGGVATNFSLLSAISTTLIALLFGMNLAMFVFYLKEKRGRITGAAVGSTSGGLAAAAVGVGCVACSSIFITAFLPAAAAGAILGFLPLGGVEFSILAVVLLTVSLAIVSRQITKTDTCVLESPGHSYKKGETPA